MDKSTFDITSQSTNSCVATMNVSLIDVYVVTNQAKTLYQLLKERDATSNISHSKLPTMEDHIAFVESKPYATWCFITNLTDGIVGAIYLTNNNEIGIQVFKKYRRRGYGLAAIRKLTSMVDPLPGVPSVRAKEFCANVAPQNEAGIALLRKAGFRLRQYTFDIPKKDAQ